MSDKTKELLQQTKALHRTRMGEIRADIDALKSQTAAANAELDVMVAEHAALGERIAQKTAEINAIEQPRLFQLKQELADVARAEKAIKA